jgi:hypothetical protein
MKREQAVVCTSSGDDVKRRSIPAFMLFLYDCARFAAILAMVKDQMYIPLITANALFPITGFFLFSDSRRYREYGPLYIAGKAVGIFAGLVWLLVTFRDRAQFSFPADGRDNYTLFFFFALAALAVSDVLSLLARLLLYRAPHKKEPIEPLQPIEPFKSAGEIANCE